MKKYLLIFLAVMLIFSCIKFKKKNNSDQNTVIITDSTSDAQVSIDFSAMEKKILQSSELDADVFFAIAVLHKKFMSQYADQLNNMQENEQKKFFHDKNAEFFNSIKYTESEYNNFMKNNAEEMTDYINGHKDIQDYLTTLN